MRPAPVTTRLARPSDAATMLRSLHLGVDTYRAFGPAGWVPRPPPDELERTAGLLRSRHTWALMAEVAGEPAGHVSLLPDPGRADAAYLWQLFVRPRWWGTGLAGELHDAFLSEARRRGYRTGRLDTPAPHARARRFYERRGWRLDGSPFAMGNFGIPLVSYRRELGA